MTIVGMKLNDNVPIENETAIVKRAVKRIRRGNFIVKKNFTAISLIHYDSFLSSKYITSKEIAH